MPGAFGLIGCFSRLCWLSSLPRLPWLFGLSISAILRGLARLAGLAVGSLSVWCLLGIARLPELLARLAIRCLTLPELLARLAELLARLAELLARLAELLTRLPIRPLALPELLTRLSELLARLTELLARLTVRPLALRELLPRLLTIWLLTIGCVGVASLIGVPLLLRQKEDDAADDSENAHSDEDPYPDWCAVRLRIGSIGRGTTTLVVAVSRSSAGRIAGFLTGDGKSRLQELRVGEGDGVAIDLATVGGVGDGARHGDIKGEFERSKTIKLRHISPAHIL